MGRPPKKPTNLPKAVPPVTTTASPSYTAPDKSEDVAPMSMRKFLQATNAERSETDKYNALEKRHEMAIKRIVVLENNFDKVMLELSRLSSWAEAVSNEEREPATPVGTKRKYEFIDDEADDDDDDEVDEDEEDGEAEVDVREVEGLDLDDEDDMMQETPKKKAKKVNFSPEY